MVKSSSDLARTAANDRPFAPGGTSAAAAPIPPVPDGGECPSRGLARPANPARASSAGASSASRGVFRNRSTRSRSTRSTRKPTPENAVDPFETARVVGAVGEKARLVRPAVVRPGVVRPLAPPGRPPPPPPAPGSRARGGRSTGTRRRPGNATRGPRRTEPQPPHGPHPTSTSVMSPPCLSASSNVARKAHHAGSTPGRARGCAPPRAAAFSPARNTGMGAAARRLRYSSLRVPARSWNSRPPGSRSTASSTQGGNGTGSRRRGPRRRRGTITPCAAYPEAAQARRARRTAQSMSEARAADDAPPTSIMTPSTPASRICSRRGASCSTARSCPRGTPCPGSITYTGTPRGDRPASAPAVGGNHECWGPSPCSRREGRRGRSSGLSQVARGRTRRDDCVASMRSVISSRPTSDSSIARSRPILSPLFQEARRFEPSALPPSPTRVRRSPARRVRRARPAAAAPRPDEPARAARSARGWRARVRLRKAPGVRC